jgi:hypothetical protein
MKRSVRIMILWGLCLAPAGCESGMNDQAWGSPGANPGKHAGPLSGDITTKTSIRNSGEWCDGLDNNGNGMVDEGCGCWLTSYQTCYSGPAQTRNVGLCRDGGQMCEMISGICRWGKCEGEITPAKEIDDGWDNDCDGMTDEGWGCNPGSLMIGENCFNGVDDDCDGFADCNDPDCCVKDTCALSPACINLSCCVPGTERWCDVTAYCSWGRQQCLADGRWGQCEEATPPPDLPSGCADSYFFSFSCCVAAGLCCQNFPVDDTSVGACADIEAPCSAGP